MHGLRETDQTCRPASISKLMEILSPTTARGEEFGEVGGLPAEATTADAGAGVKHPGTAPRHVVGVPPQRRTARAGTRFPD